MATLVELLARMNVPRKLAAAQTAAVGFKNSRPEKSERLFSFK
jgi:hypothetical protein